MPPDPPSFFSRDELTAGLPARRASTLLFAIEARTAHLVARSRRAMATYETARSSQERERAFLDAMAGGRELPTAPTARDLERFAPRWADLVPEGPELRASLARLLSQKYDLPRSRVPRIRSALGLDEATVGEAYERLHREPLTAVYSATVSKGERLRWAKARATRTIEELPPFWAAYALALTETIGEGILVLPIALAGIGPIPAMVVLIVLGLVNLLTIGGLVEAITRSGDMRYGTAYFGRLASGLLGRSGSVGITVALFAFNVVTFLAYLLAFAAPLAEATGIPVGVWTVGLFAVNLYFLRRELDATVASAIVIGAINIGLILAISAIAFAHVDVANLRFARIPFVGDDSAGASVVALIFGVVLVAYFGHTSAGNVAKVILGREPSGQALFWGNVAAVATVIFLYGLAVFAINGALAPEALAGYPGTSLEPLAAEVGGSVHILGSLYVTLAIGLGSIYVSLGLFNQVREWLPQRTAEVPGFIARLSSFAASERGAFFVSVLPLVLTFVALEWLVLVGAASLADSLSLIGAFTVPLLGGIFPMLLLAAARRRGEYVPGASVRLLRGPVAMGSVAVLFVVGLLVQGFVIWQRPGERIAAAGVTALMAAITWQAVRRGAFRPRTVVEVRRERSGRGMVTVTSSGRRIDVPVSLELAGGTVTHEGRTVDRFSDLRALSLRIPSAAVGELKVWVHAVTAEGDSEPIAAVVSRDGDPATLRIVLEETR